MNTISRLLLANVTTPDGDIRLARRGSQLAAIIIVGAMGWAMWRHATNAVEMIVAGGLGVLTAALMVAMASLTALLSERLRTGTAPSRWLEYVGYGLTVAMLAGGFYSLSRASLDRIGFLTWMLALLASCLAMVCLAKVSTLRRVTKNDTASVET